jgi:hypothetical protein
MTHHVWALPGAKGPLEQEGILRARQSHHCLDPNSPCVSANCICPAQFGDRAERIILLDMKCCFALGA